MEKVSKSIIISPSGKFYGSEQVLFDFLNNCQYIYDVYVPVGGELGKKLVSQSRHRLFYFSVRRLPVFYLKIFWKLLAGSYEGVYVNEGGHIRYVLMLARWLKKKKFTVHLRMIYDASGTRLGTRPLQNVSLVTISNYIASAIDINWKPEVVYDPFAFDGVTTPENPKPVISGRFKIGIIGRISATKGFDLAYDLIRHLDQTGNKNYEFHFYGDFTGDETIAAKANELSSSRNIIVKFWGYRDKTVIYDSIHAIVHFCLEEGLGRVYLEAIDAEKPFIGFKSGGLIEIAEVFELRDQLLKFDRKAYIGDLLHKMEKLKSEYAAEVKSLRAKKIEKYKLFSVERYCSIIEHKLNQI